MTNWTAEDEKLVTLAKGARTRISASSGAAVRDTTGRTYSSAEVDEEFLKLSAIELSVGQAIASGATALEAVVLCAELPITEADQKIIFNFSGIETPIFLVNSRGERVDT